MGILAALSFIAGESLWQAPSYLNIFWNHVSSHCDRGGHRVHLYRPVGLKACRLYGVGEHSRAFSGRLLDHSLASCAHPSHWSTHELAQFRER